MVSALKKTIVLYTKTNNSIGIDIKVLTDTKYITGTSIGGVCKDMQ